MDGSVLWATQRPPEKMAKIGGTKALEIMCGSIPRDGEWRKLLFEFAGTSSAANQAVTRVKALYPSAEFTVSKEDGAKFVYVRFPAEEQ